MISLAALERRCQKPDHRRVGNWMARRVARPAALRITWIVSGWGVPAMAATLAAWACGAGAALCLCGGTPWSWLAGAALLQLWYLLDHVDGQLARLRGTASLDGAQLDYLMHHTVNLLVPLGAGWGICSRTNEPRWMLAGVVWGVSLLMITLQHDARYRAFFQRLKRLEGTLEVVGGGGGRPEPQPPMPRSPARLVAWLARKSCEAHVVMNMILLVAIGQLITGDRAMLAGRAYLAAASSVAAATAAWVVARSQRRQDVEAEFAAWFRLPRGAELTFVDGRWEVVAGRRQEDRRTGGRRQEAGDRR